MVGPLYAFILATVPTVDHSVSVGAISVCEDKQFRYGYEFLYEGQLIYESVIWKAAPRHMHFNDKSFIYSLEVGPEIFVQDVVVGIKAAYDLSNLSGKMFYQKSLGFEFITDTLEFGIRHYVPTPSKRSFGDSIINAHSHLDVDVIHKIGRHSFGFSPYIIEKCVGIKSSFNINIFKLNFSGNWRYDEIKKHQVTFGISWNFLSPKKTISKHNPYIVTSSVTIPNAYIQKTNLSDIKSDIDFGTGPKADIVAVEPLYIETIPSEKEVTPLESPQMPNPEQVSAPVENKSWYDFFFSRSEQTV